MLKILIDSLLDLCTLFPYLDFGLASLFLSCYGLYKRLYDPETDKNWQAKLSFELASLISTNLTNPKSCTKANIDSEVHECLLNSSETA